MSFYFFFFKQKTAYEMRISDWSSDVCSSDLRRLLEYEQMKLAAQKLDALPQLGRDFQRSHAYVDLQMEQALPEISPEDLRSAWLDIMRRASRNAHHLITREQFSVRAHMRQILRLLRAGSSEKRREG